MQSEQPGSDQGHRRGGLRAAVLAVALVAATPLLASGLTRPDSAAADARSLVVTDEGDVLVVDFARGETTRVAEHAVAAADGSRVYRARIADQDTVVEEIDPASASVVAETRIRGKLELRVVSPRGGAVALRRDRAGGGAYGPEANDLTHLTVLRTQDSASRTYELAGNFEPEAFSRDEDRLFLLEYWPPRSPDRYFVRQLHLGTGEVADVFSPEVGLETEMRGRARGQAISPAGDFLYTLYALDAGMPDLYDHHTGGPTRAFIHVLSLTEDWSHCVFLQPPFGSEGGAAYGLGLSPDGSTLAAVDRLSGTLAVFDTEDHVVATEPVDGMWPPEGRVADVPVAVADDGTVYFAQEAMVVEIAAGDRSVTAYSAGQRVRALDVTSDGRQLRVAAGSRVSVLDREHRVEVTTLEVAGTVARFGPPAGHLAEVDLTCAC